MVGHSYNRHEYVYVCVGNKYWKGKYAAFGTCYEGIWCLQLKPDYKMIHIACSNDEVIENLSQYDVVFVHFLCNHTHSPLGGDINSTHIVAINDIFLWVDANGLGGEASETAHVWTPCIDKVSLMLHICLASSLWMNDQHQDSSELETTFSSAAHYSYILENQSKLTPFIIILRISENPAEAATRF